MNNYTLIVIGSGVYPKGCAPTNRIHLYCKAFRDNGGSPLVVSLDAPFNEKQSFGYIGRYEGIPFCYSRRSYIRKTNFFKRNTQRFLGFVNSLSILYKHRKRNPNTVVLFFSVLRLDEIILTIFLKLSGIKILKEYNEAPLYIIENRKNPGFHRFRLKYLKLKRYDGIIVISDFLKEFFSGIYPENRTFQIPILVDLKRFDVSPGKDARSDARVITYIGALGRNKDGLDILLESVSIVRRTSDNIKLIIACNGPEDELRKLREMIYKAGLTDSVSILVGLDSREITVLLKKSDLLVLARPDNNQAKAGFPTKLGEYLASKRPVVITKTGEIPKYLEDRKSAYLAEPGDVNDFARKLLFALNDPDSDKIGMEGFHIAERYFDYRIYGKELIEICIKVSAKAN